MKKEQAFKTTIINNQHINFQAYGVKVGIKVNNGDYLLEIEKRLGKILPNGFQIIDKNEIDHILLIRQKKNGDFQLFRNEENVANSSSEEEFYEIVESEIRLTIAEYAVSRVFLHAGVVGWKGKAIVIPGSSFSGKTSLVAALIKKGALYYSDEYAVLDETGNVHPFPKMLSLRGIIDDYQQVDCTAESLGGEVGFEPLPVRMVLLTKYDSTIDSAESDANIFEPEVLSGGRAMLEIILQTIPIRNNPKFTLQVLNKVVNDAIIVRSRRGEAQKFADLLLDFFEKAVTKGQ
jgi:hypothetical protein